jgi:hypothetical protein
LIYQHHSGTTFLVAIIDSRVVVGKYKIILKHLGVQNIKEMLKIKTKTGQVMSKGDRSQVKP